MIRIDDRIAFPTRSIDVLTVGELLIDMISIEYDEKHEGNTYHKYFGGSPSNIAMNATKLGLRSLVSAAVGNDAFGNYLIDKLRDAGIETQGVQRVDGSTSMVVVNKSRSTPTPIFYRDADYRLSCTPLLEEFVIQSKIVHFSCWPISREPARQTIEQVLKVAKQHNVLIGFDPNYHPMVWQKGEDGVSYIESVIGKVDIVKPSEDDAERLFGRDTPENHVKRFVELGAKLVVMTLGKDGSIISNGSETIRFGTMAEEIVDTTGAGDAFWSGFYAGLVKGHSVRKALTLGFAVSAYKLKYTGAVVDLPRLEYYKEFNGGE
ncbi:5-dehydro-2-deoxygluconokinase [compost metagenome]